MNSNLSGEKAKIFHDLHHAEKILVLPNIWDPLGALLLEKLNFPAIATASASIAFTNGYKDGEKIEFSKLLTLLKTIADSVKVPVTADIESGYANSNNQLKENIKQLLDIGIAGINFEDTDKQTGEFIPIEIQCEKISLIKKVADDAGIPLFINARTDVYIHSQQFNSEESKFDEAMKRGLAYKSAGADGFYPILIKNKEQIESLVSGLNYPINILTFPGIPDLDTLQKINVARVSLGPSFLKTAIKALMDLATKLQKNEGLNEITGNEITSDYLKELVNKKN